MRIGAFFSDGFELVSKVESRRVVFSCGLRDEIIVAQVQVSQLLIRAEHFEHEEELSGCDSRVFEIEVFKLAFADILQELIEAFLVKVDLNQLEFAQVGTVQRVHQVGRELRLQTDSFNIQFIQVIGEPLLEKCLQGFQSAIAEIIPDEGELLQGGHHGQRGDDFTQILIEQVVVLQFDPICEVLKVLGCFLQRVRLIAVQVDFLHLKDAVFDVFKDGGCLFLHILARLLEDLDGFRFGLGLDKGAS